MCSFQDCLGHAHVLLAAFERVRIHTNIIYRNIYIERKNRNKTSFQLNRVSFFSPPARRWQFLHQASQAEANCRFMILLIIFINSRIIIHLGSIIVDILTSSQYIVKPAMCVLHLVVHAMQDVLRGASVSLVLI